MAGKAHAAGMKAAVEIAKAAMVGTSIVSNLKINYIYIIIFIYIYIY